MSAFRRGNLTTSKKHRRITASLRSDPSRDPHVLFDGTLPRFHARCRPKIRACPKRNSRPVRLSSFASARCDRCTFAFLSNICPPNTHRPLVRGARWKLANRDDRKYDRTEGRSVSNDVRRLDFPLVRRRDPLQPLDAFVSIRNVFPFLVDFYFATVPLMRGPFHRQRREREINWERKSDVYSSCYHSLRETLHWKKYNYIQGWRKEESHLLRIMLSTILPEEIKIENIPCEKLRA